LWAAAYLVTPGAAVGQDFLVHTFEASSRVYSVNPDTGGSALLGSAGVQLADLALTPGGQLFGASLTGLYAVNPATGAASLIGPFGATTSMVGLDAGAGGSVFGVSQNGGFFAVNPATGGATLQFAAPLTYTGDVAYFAGSTFYATASFGDGSHLIEINAAGHTTVDRGLIAAGELSPGLDFDLNGRLIAFGASGRAFAIPNFSSSGSGVLLGNAGIAMAGATTLPASVPEPAVLFLCGLSAAVGFLGWRYRKATRAVDPSLECSGEGG
jgi:hypothetical protein